MCRAFFIFSLLVSIIIPVFSVSCNDKTDNFVTHDLTITPSTTEPGESVLVEFYMDNKGFKGVLSTWTLEIDGEKIAEKKISAERRDTTRGYFKLTAHSTGNHIVSVFNTGDERLSGWFLVVESKDALFKD